MVKPYAWLCTCESGSRYMVFESEKPKRNNEGGWTTSQSKWAKIESTGSIRHKWEDEPIALYTKVVIDESLQGPLRSLLESVEQAESDGMNSKPKFKPPASNPRKTINPSMEPDTWADLEYIYNKVGFCHTQYMYPRQHETLRKIKEAAGRILGRSE